MTNIVNFTNWCRATFSEYIPISTNMRAGRNYINILSSDIIVVCGMGWWTSSEVSLAIGPWKKVILVWTYKEANDFYKKLAPNQIFVVTDFNEAIKVIKDIL